MKSNGKNNIYLTQIPTVDGNSEDGKQQIQPKQLVTQRRRSVK